MSFNKTRYLRKKVLDHVFGRVSYTFPTNVWIALFTDDPTELGSLDDEVTGGSYARIAITSLMSDATLATGIITNSAAITFATATTDWGTVTHAAIMDAVSAGSMLYYGPAVTARVVDNGETFEIKIGQLTVQEL